jgi:hypothetical protein
VGLCLCRDLERLAGWLGIGLGLSDLPNGIRDGGFDPNRSFALRCKSRDLAGVLVVADDGINLGLLFGRKLPIVFLGDRLNRSYFGL